MMIGPAIMSIINDASKVMTQLSPVLRSPNQELELPIARLKELGIERAEQFRAFVELTDNL